MSRFLQGDYRTLVPYQPGEQPKRTERLIKLNTNENPYPPAPAVAAIMKDEELRKLRLYPDPEATELTEAIADHYGIRKDNVMVGNGSDEILAFLLMAFQGRQGRVYYPEISYSFYPVYCNLFHAEGIKVPLRQDFSIDQEHYYDLDGTILITNPNAPTGMALEVDEIAEILRRNRDNLVVIDEAYVDFGAESAVRLITEHDNLLVVQTFSKSRSLAGARIGFAMGNEEIIADLNRIKFSFNPYNLNRLSILAATEAMKDQEYFQATCGKIRETRERFTESMKALGFSVLPSKANFVFASSGRISAETYFNALREHHIIVRYFKNEKIRNFVRISIGTPEEMEALIQATKQILKAHA